MATHITSAKAHISHSQVNTFQTCSYKWLLTYRVGLRTRSSEVAPATLGDVVHYALAMALRKSWEWRQDHYPTSYDYLRWAIDTAVSTWDEQNRPVDKTTVQPVDDGLISVVGDTAFYADWDEMIDNARHIALRTLKNMRFLEKYDVLGVGGDNDDEPVPLVEYDLNVDIPGTDFTFAGRVDAVLKNRYTGMVEVIDWKVRGRFSGPESERLSDQIGLYQHALRELGVDAQVGVVYQIKNTVPATPKLNKDGSMSRQKITTDWATYEAALLDAGLNPDEYQDMQDKLAGVEFFRPLMVVRTPEVTSLLWDNLIQQARRIAEARHFPYSFGYPCRQCAFADWCNAELYGYDREELLAVRYEMRESVDNSPTVDDEEIGE